MVLLALALLCMTLQDSAAAATDAPLAAGDTWSGTLTRSAPQAGQEPRRRLAPVGREVGSVTIAVMSFDFDAHLRIENDAGEVLAEDEDSGVETDARIVFELEGEEPCWVIVSGRDGNGEFRLEVRPGSNPAPTGEELALAGIRWQAQASERALARGNLVAAANHRLLEAGRRYARHEYPAAGAAYEQALVLLRRTGERAIEARTLRRLGVVSEFLGDYAAAKDYHERHLELAFELDDRAAVTNAFLDLGIVYFSTGEYTLAREHLEESLALARDTGDRASEGDALGNLGSVYYSLGDYERAADAHSEALSIGREVGNEKGIAATLGNLGIVYSVRGDYRRSIESHEQSLALSRALGDRPAEARTLGNLANAELQVGDHSSAEKRYEQQLALGRALALPGIEAEAFLGLARVYHARGEFVRAREYCERQLSFSRSIGDRRRIAAGLAVLGNASYSLGDYARARELHEESLEKSRELGEAESEAMALGNLGNVAYSIGDYATARDHWNQSLSLFRRMGNLSGEATILGDLGNAHYSLGEYGLAADCIEEQLSRAREMGHREVELFALGSLGHLHLARGDLERALDIFEEGHALALELGNRSEEARALGNLAALHEARGEPTVAYDLAHQANALSVELGTRGTRITSLGILIGTSLAMGEAERAQRFLQEADASIDAVTSSGLEIGDASKYRAQYAGLSELAQDCTVLLREEADDDEAARASAIEWGFVAAGRWKGRRLLEGIAEHRRGARSTEAIELRRQRREALAAADAALRRVASEIQGNAASDEVQALREEARAQLGIAQQLSDELRRVSPRDASLDLAHGASSMEVRSKALGAGELLIEFVDGRDDTYAYVIGLGGPLLIDLGPRDEIVAEVDRFLAGIRDRTRLAEPAELGAAGGALFRRLIAPALAAVDQEVRGLVIVPNAQLASVPFEALVVEESTRPPSLEDLVFVLDRFEVTYGPSAPVLVELAAAPARKEPGPLLILADPQYASEGSVANSRFKRLPGTREEAFTIGALVDHGDARLAELRDERSGSYVGERLELHLGEEAAPSRLDGDLRRYSVVHLACHGFVDAQLSQRSGIALSPRGPDDGFFTILDALELDLNCELVVLSACQTARSEVRTGEGIESLARAFLYAGSRGLVASQWSVDDRAAAETMEAFYRGWLTGGHAPARALREAKLAARHGRSGAGPERGVGVVGTSATTSAAYGTDHPFFWAPFIHVGLGR